MAKTETAKSGRPIKLTPEVSDRICEIICNAELGIGKLIQNNPEMPTMSTLFKWLRENAEFAKQYARAKEIQAEMLAEQILDISDDSSGDEMINDKGERKENTEFVNRSKLRVDSRKWLASKLLPKKYGEKQTIEHEGEIKTPIQPPTIIFEISKEIADKATAKLNAKP